MKTRRVLEILKGLPQEKLVAFQDWAGNGYYYVTDVAFCKSRGCWRSLVTASERKEVLTVKDFCKALEADLENLDTKMVAVNPSVSSYRADVDYILTKQIDGAIVLCYDDGEF